MIDSKIPIEVSQSTLNHFQEIVKIDSFRPLRVIWLVKALNTIDDGVSVTFCLDLMRAILSTFPTKPSELDRETILLVIQKLISSPHNLLEVFFDDFSSFQQGALQKKENMAKSNPDQPFDEIVLSGRQPFLAEIQARLKFFHFILVNYDSVLDSRYYGMLWDILVDHAVTPASADACFQWLLDGRKEDQTYVSVDDRNAHLLFVDRFLNLRKFSPLGFKAFERYFIDANIKTHQMMWKSKPANEFVVLSLNLIGYTYLWQILLEHPQCEPDITKEVIEFLVRITLKPSATLLQEYGVTRIREELLTQCMENLKKLTTEFHIEKSTETEVAITRLLELLICFCTKCTQEADLKIKSHGSITRGKPLTLLISNAIQPESGQTWTLDCHSNEKLKQIKFRIRKLLGKAFEGNLAELFLSTKDDQELTDENFTLEDLKINNNQNLFIKSNQGVEKGQETVNRSRHSKAWTPKRTEKPPANAQESAKTVMEITNVKEPLAMLALKKNDWDVSTAVTYLMEEDNHNLLLQEAQRMQIDEPEESPQSEAIGELIPQTSILPGFMISFNFSYFDQLFQLLKIESPQVAAKLWELLMLIPTAQNTSEKISQFYMMENIEWKDIFDVSSHYTLLYSLQIVDSIVFPMDDTLVLEQRATWATALLKRGGVHYLLETMLSRQWFAKTEQSWKEPAAQERTCLALISKVVDFFLYVLIGTEENPDANFDHRDSKATAEVNKVDSLIRKYIVEEIPALIENINFEKLIFGCMEIAQASTTVPADASTYSEIVSYALRMISLTTKADPKRYWPVLFKHPGFHKFISYGLLSSPLPAIRAEIALMIFNLAHLQGQVVATQDCPLPRDFFLKFLFENLPDPKTTDRVLWTTCGQFWSLLEKLISLDIQDNTSSARDYKQTLFQFCQDIKQRPVVEQRSSQLVDEILVGLMNTLKTLVHHFPETRQTIGQQEGLLNELYSNCLFAVDAGPQTDAPPKCKNKAGRLVAFNLMTELAIDCNENLLDILAKLAKNHSQNPKLKTWTYQPSEDDKSPTGYVGLRNLGNTCYMNSLMQQFFMIPTLRYGMNSIELNPEQKPDNLVRQIQNIFAHLQESQKLSFAAEAFCEHYKDLEGNKMNIHAQQDVDEFFNLLCQRIEAQLKGTPHENLLSSIFAGKVSNQILSKDKEYPYASESLEDYFTISIEIKGKQKIEEGLDLFVKGDSLEGENAYYCDKYNKNIDAIKRGCIKTLANTVIIHLKRFEFDYSTFRKQKVHDRVEFPEYLNLKPWTKEGLALKEGRAVEPDDIHPDSYYEYELRGVLVHSGGADAGHYYSYIKERVPENRDHSNESSGWFEFNDRVTKFFDPKELPAEGFGGTQLCKYWDHWQRQYVEKTYDRIRSAYMLFYDRIKPEGNLFTKLTNPETKKGLTNSDLVRGIPQDLYKKVWEENSTFLRDRQLFDPSYFDFMRTIHQLYDFEAVLEYPEHPDQNLQDILEKDQPFRTIKLATEFVIEILAHSQNSPNFKSWIKLLKNMYSKHIPACLWFVDTLIQKKLIKELTLECSEEKVRIGLADLIIHVLRQLKNYERPFYTETIEVEEKPQSSKDKAEIKKKPKAWTLRFMNILFGLLEDSRVYWKRFKQYFWIIREFSTFGWQERQYWLEKELLSEYADYFMGRTRSGQMRRVPVMDDHNLPDLTEFISTLSWIVRGCETGSTKGPPPTTIPDDRILRIPDREYKLFYEKNFFCSMLEMDYNAEAAVEIITHICWEDIKQTKYILEIIMGEVGKSWASEKLPVHKNLLDHLLQIEDSLQDARVALVCTPFTSSNIKGLLSLIRSQHNQNPKLAFQLIKYIVHLILANEAVAKYLAKQRSEMIWIQQFLEAKLGADFPSDEKPTEKMSAAKQNTINCLRTIKDFLAKQSGSQEDMFREEREQLLEEMEKLRQRNNELTEALFYYRRNAPKVPVPSIVRELDDDYDTKSEEEKTATPDDNDGLSGAGAASETEMTPMLTYPGPSPEQIEMANTLASIFPNVSVPVALFALKANDYDLDVTSLRLTEEGYLNYIQREVEDQQQPRADAGQKDEPSPAPTVPTREEANQLHQSHEGYREFDSQKDTPSNDFPNQKDPRLSNHNGEPTHNGVSQMNDDPANNVD